MALFGQLSTMSLMDLLQWAGINRKTGVFELERNKIKKKLLFRDGIVVACYCDDPQSRLGQFLLSRGKITPDQLKDALGRQQATGESIGAILTNAGLVTTETLTDLMSQKAEEMVLGLFDWQEAIFRFEEDGDLGPYVIEVELSVDDILLKGLQRIDELSIIRQTFHHSGIVLELSGKTLPPEVEKSSMARRIVDSINGDRTLAEVLLHANASEFLVLKFLYNLFNRGVLRTGAVRDPSVETVTIVDPWRSENGDRRESGDSDAVAAEVVGAAPAAVMPESAPLAPETPAATEPPEMSPEMATAIESMPDYEDEPAQANDDLTFEFTAPVPSALDGDTPDAGTPGAGAPAPTSETWAESESLADAQPEPRVDEAAEAVRQLAIEMEETLTIVPWSEKKRRAADLDEAHAERMNDLTADLDRARELIGGNDFGAALDLLNRAYVDFPDDAHLKELITRAESGYVTQASGIGLAPTGVPRRTANEEGVDQLPPQSAYVLSMIDGHTDIRSLNWLAPMREVEVLRVLDRLRSLGLIEIATVDSPMKPTG